MSKKHKRKLPSPPRLTIRLPQGVALALTPGVSLKAIAASHELPGDRPAVSLCLIAKNESANLPRLFDSVRGAVDEIFVVDTGSTDDTVALAQAAGAKVAHLPWRDDFAAAKNFAIQNATGRWILALDADMEVAAGHAPRIRAAADSGSARAFYLNVHSPRADGVTIEVVVHPWLFENVPGVEFAGRVHESILSSLIARGLTPARTDINITHFGYADERGLAARGERDARILEAEVKAGRGDAHDEFHLARAYARLGRVAEASGTLKSLISRAYLPPALRASAHIQLMRLAPSMEGREAALRGIDEAVRFSPNDRMTLTIAADNYIQLGAIEKAVECLEGALVSQYLYVGEANVLERRDEELRLQFARCLVGLRQWPRAIGEFQRLINAGLRSAEVYCSLGLTHSLMGETAQAEAAFTAALQTDPAHADAHRQLGFLYTETNRLPQALIEFGAAIAGGCRDADLLQAMKYVKAQTQATSIEPA